MNTELLSKKINRIYYESIEQAIFIKTALSLGEVEFVKIKKSKLVEDNIISILNSAKNYDLILSSIDKNNEIIILAIEFSTAIATDDHKMQRSDGPYFSTLLDVPFLKISPTENKSLNNGGGSRLTTDREFNIYRTFGAKAFHIPWPVDEDGNVIYDDEFYSCPDVSDKLKDLVQGILLKPFLNQNELFNNIKLPTHENDFFLKKSKRIYMEDGIPTCKINRFTHGMDPDKGVTFFYKMLYGKVNVFFDFDKNLSKIADSFANNEEVKVLYEGFNRNSIFKMLKIIFPGSIDSIAGDVIIYNDNYTNFSQIATISEKMIFFRDGTEIEFKTAKKEENNIYKYNSNIQKIRKCDIKDYTEDDVTYSLVKLLEKKYEIISVSYPGAQGNKPILIGSGRTVKRSYVDIVARKDDKLLLVEAKKNFKDLHKDVKKINNMIMSNKDEIFSTYGEASEVIGVYAAVKGENNISIDKGYISFEDLQEKISNILPTQFTTKL